MIWPLGTRPPSTWHRHSGQCLPRFSSFSPALSRETGKQGENRGGHQQCKKEERKREKRKGGTFSPSPQVLLAFIKVSPAGGAGFEEILGHLDKQAQILDLPFHLTVLGHHRLQLLRAPRVVFWRLLQDGHNITEHSNVARDSLR